MIESSQEIEIRKYLNLAEQHEKNGDSHATKEALLEAQKLAKKYQNQELNLVAGYNYGTCLVNSGEPRKGVEALLKVISLLPGEGEKEQKSIDIQNLYYNLGIGLAYVGEWNTCFKIMEKIINPNLYAKAAMTRGKAAERMRKFDVALEELLAARQAAEKNKDWSTLSKAWFYESKVNQNISNTAAATDALRKAAAMSEKIGDESEKREHKALIGEALTEAQLYKEAQSLLSQAVGTHSPKTFYLLASNFMVLKQWKEAINAFQEAARGFMVENNLEMSGLCYAGEGKANLKVGNYSGALAAYKSALTTYEEITISSIRKSVGLWEANAGIGESLYKIGQYEDSVSPISESIALLEAERKNIDGEIKRMKQLLRRANRKAGKDFGNESDSSVNTLRSTARPPKILNTLQDVNNGVLLKRPFLTRSSSELSYRTQLITAKPKLSHREAISAMMCSKNSVIPNNTVFPVQGMAFPKARTRREKGSGHEQRPMSASRQGLRSSGQYDSDSDIESPAEILKRVEQSRLQNRQKNF